MNRELLNRHEAKLGGVFFAVAKNGTVTVSQKGDALKPKLAQMGTILFETIGAVGNIKIDSLQIAGSKRGLLMEFTADDLTGALLEAGTGVADADVMAALSELHVEHKEQPRVETKAKVQLTPAFLEEIKGVLKEYVGDFADRIYTNQLKAQRINPDSYYDDDARRLIFALGKAAGMIIGPTKGQDLTNKLITRLK